MSQEKFLEEGAEGVGFNDLDPYCVGVKGGVSLNRTHKMDGKKPNSAGKKELVSLKAEGNASVEGQTFSKSLDGSQPTVKAVYHQRSKLNQRQNGVKEGEVGGVASSSKAGKKVDSPPVLPRPEVALSEFQEGVEARAPASLDIAQMITEADTECV